jgi:hypothetical protein
MPSVRSRPNASQLIEIVARVTSAELVAAATTQAIDLFTLPADAVVLSVDVDVEEGFADSGAISALVLEVGLAADPDAFFLSSTVFGVTGKAEKPGAWFAGDGAAIEGKFTATGANLGDGAATALDAGVVEIRAIYVVAPGT